VNGEFGELFEAIKEYQKEKWKHHDERVDDFRKATDANTDELKALKEVIYETQRSILIMSKGLPCEARKRDLLWLRIFGFGIVFVLFWLIQTR